MPGPEEVGNKNGANSARDFFSGASAQPPSSCLNINTLIKFGPKFVEAIETQCRDKPAEALEWSLTRVV